MQEKNYEFKRKWFDYLGYEPHNGQLALHYPVKDKARFQVIVCGRRFGKTWASAMEATYVASQPDKRIWLVGMSYRKARLIFREIWQRMVIGHSEDIDKASEKDMYIRFKWGTIVEGMSADNPDSLVGEGVDLLVIDEVAKMNKKIWDMYLSPTVAGRKGKVIFITTPEGRNWIYDLFKLGEEDPLWDSHTSPSWINQYEFPEGLSDPAIIERKRNMSKELFAQEFGAEFSVFEGKVWDFHRDLDVGEFPYDPNLPTYCTIDFGYRMPAVIFCQTYWENEVEHIRIFDCILHKKDIKTEDLIKRIKTKGYPVMSFYGDPAGANVQGQSGAGDMEIFRRSGIKVISTRDRMSRNIVASVAYTRGFFESASGIRRIHVDSRCKDVIEDFEEYRYPESEDGKAIKEEPLKDGYHDHGNDAFRYFIINRFPMKNTEMKRIQR
jgi:hypothetical protein|tara:strand:- start:985 stop:2298 length:1314 start_codon:yes stop_codon:yes gene_type:complete